MLACVGGSLWWMASDVITGSARRNDAARAAGFYDATELEAAKAASFSDPTEYRTKIERDRVAALAAKKVADEQRIAADAAAYAKKQADLEAKRITKPKLTLVTWEKSGFGSVALVTLKIENTSAKGAIRDIRVGCSFEARSGTLLDIKFETIYETIPPKKSFTAKSHSFGFIDKQAGRATCTYLGAKADDGMKIDE